MKVKEALEHNWQIGEKVWVVCRQIIRNGPMSGSCKPMYILEVPVSGIKRDDQWKIKWEYLEVNFDWESVNLTIPGSDFDYESAILCAMVTHYGSRDTYDHAGWCTNKFFNKADAEKRLKKEIESWNKKVEQKIANEKANLKNVKKELERLEKVNNYNFDEYIIK